VAAGDGCALWTAVSGADTGRGFVLCHGGPGFWDTLGPVAEVLGVYGRVIRWDQRGGGRSEHRVPYSVGGCVADLDAVRGHYGLDRVTVVGHSWGATLALQYALAFPGRVEQVVYVSGTGLSWAWHAQYKERQRDALGPYAARLAELDALPGLGVREQREGDLLRVAAEFRDPATALEYAAAQVTPYFVSDPLVNASINTETRGYREADLVERCRALRVPVVVVDGALDLRPRWAVDSLVRALPDVERVTLEGSGHFPWIDEPGGFRAALARVVG
jgi:proline iminopeptidase